MTDIKPYLKLHAALVNEKSRIEARLTEISKVLGRDGLTAAPDGPWKRTMSKPAKAWMRVAQKARWGKINAAKANTGSQTGR